MKLFSENRGLRERERERGKEERLKLNLLLGRANDPPSNGWKRNGVIDNFRIPKPGAAFYAAQLAQNYIIEPSFYWILGIPFSLFLSLSLFPPLSLSLLEL